MGPVLPPEAMLKFEDHATAKGHVDVHGPAVVWGCVDTHSPCYYQRHVNVQGLCCPMKTMLRTTVHARSEGRVDACGLYCCQKAYVNLSSLLLLTLNVKKATFAMALLTADSQLRLRDIDVICDNFSHRPHRKKQSV